MDIDEGHIGFRLGGLFVFHREFPLSSYSKARLSFRPAHDGSYSHGHDEGKGRLAILLAEISQLDGADEVVRDWYLGDSHRFREFHNQP